MSSQEWPEIRYQTPTHNEVLRLGVAHATNVGYGVAPGDWYVYSTDTNRMDLIVARLGGLYLAAMGGNVGVGTTVPVEKLHVVGNGKIEGNLTVTGTLSATIGNTTAVYAQ